MLVFALIPAAIYTLSYLPYAWAEGDSSLTGLVGSHVGKPEVYALLPQRRHRYPPLLLPLVSVAL